MDRMAGLALAGAGIAAGGLGMAAATGNLPVSKQQQLEELKAQGITPTPEQEKEARDEQLAMWGTIALAMGGGLGLGIGGDQALSLDGDSDSPFWADGSAKSPPGGGGGGGPWPRPGGGSRMAADPETVALAQQMAEVSPWAAAEVEAIMARKAGVAPPVRAEATRYWAPVPESELLDNLSGIDLPRHWHDVRKDGPEQFEIEAMRHPGVFGLGGVMDQVIDSGVDRSPAALADLQYWIDRDQPDMDVEKDIAGLERDASNEGRMYVIPRNKTIPNDSELGLGIPTRVDPMSLRELVSGEPDGSSFFDQLFELEDRQARSEVGDDTYWVPEHPYRPPSDASFADRQAYRAYEQGLSDWMRQYDSVQLDGQYWDVNLDDQMHALRNSLYGGQPVYNQPDAPRPASQRPRRRGRA